MHNNQIDAMNEWREKQPVKNIKTKEIIINHPEHLNAEFIHMHPKMNELGKYLGGRVVPIVLRPVNGCNYELLFGLKQLTKAKLMNMKTISSVVVEDSREDLIYKILNPEEIISYDIRKIKIDECFLNSTPSGQKMAQKFLEINSGIDKPIILENGVLVDGYITYLLKKELKYTMVSVINRHREG